MFYSNQSDRFAYKKKLEVAITVFQERVFQVCSGRMTARNPRTSFLLFHRSLPRTVAMQN